MNAKEINVRNPYSSNVIYRSMSRIRQFEIAFKFVSYYVDRFQIKIKHQTYSCLLFLLLKVLMNSFCILYNKIKYKYKINLTRIVVFGFKLKVLYNLTISFPLLYLRAILIGCFTDFI